MRYKDKLNISKNEKEQLLPKASRITYKTFKIK